MSSYGLTLEDVKDVVIGCGLYIERGYIPLPLGNKYIIEARDLDGKYCQILLCSHTFFDNKDVTGARVLEDELSYTSSPTSCTGDPRKKYLEIISCELPDLDHLFHSVIVKTGDFEERLQETEIYKTKEYGRVIELMSKYNIETVADKINPDYRPFWYKIVLGPYPNNEEPDCSKLQGLVSGTEMNKTVTDFNKQTLEDTIPQILEFGEIIDALVKEKQKGGNYQKIA